MRVTLKASSLGRGSNGAPLLCEVADDALSFAGDMGAIGRISCVADAKDGLKIDLKGLKINLR
jgi:hypothetical protein